MEKTCIIDGGKHDDSTRTLIIQQSCSFVLYSKDQPAGKPLFEDPSQKEEEQPTSSGNSFEALGNTGRFYNRGYA